MKDLQINGILPPLTTPFHENGELDCEALARNVARYNETGLAGYVALGSNGEAVHLSADERVQVIKTIKRAAAADKIVIGGVNEFSTQAASEACRRAADVGADAALVVTPYFYKGAMTGDVFRRHFTAVAEASPIPVLLYNVPQNTGVVIESATIAALAEHPNLLGIKDSAGNMGAMAETLRRVPVRFQVLTGNASILYPALAMGAKGAILAVACVAPRPCVELYDAVQAGNHVTARELQNRLAPLAHLVTVGFGVAGLKAALEIAGFVGGRPRLPLAPLGETERATLSAAMRDSGLFAELE